jgi:hypothetical protein
MTAAAKILPGGEHVSGSRSHRPTADPQDSADPVPLRLGGRPAHVPAYAAVGLPLAVPVTLRLNQDPGLLGDVAQALPVLLPALVGAAAVGMAVRRLGQGRLRRRHRGVSLSPRTRARLRLRPGPGFATRGQLYRDYGRWTARRVAKHGRKSLSTRDRWLGPWQEYATYHGRAQGLLHRWGVYSTFEDLLLMIAPPQEGKSQKTAASIVDAPGPLAVTSIRGDLIRDTAGLRQQLGYVWVFNPEGVGDYGSNMRWNPVTGCQDIVIAVRRAGYMVEASENKGLSDGQFWADWGTMMLASLMHAAGLIGGTLRDVNRWLGDPREGDTALRILVEHEGASEVALEFVRRVQEEMTDRTRDGVISSLQRVMRFMIHPGVVDVLCPTVGPGEFDFVQFLRSKDTVYLVSDSDEQSMSAPIFSAFLAELAITSNEIGNKYHAGGGTVSRLDPPLTIEGDELGNCAPVPVDRWASWAAGSGIRIHMYFQTFARIEERWGEKGAEALWSASKIKIVGSGVTEEAVLNRMCRLIGKIDVREQDDITYDARGNQIKRPRWSQVDVMAPADIRAIPRGKALVLRSGAGSPTLITLDTIRSRKASKEWVKAGRPVEGLWPPATREIPGVRPELRTPRPAPEPLPEVDEMSAWRARRSPDSAPPLPLPSWPGNSDTDPEPAPVPEEDSGPEPMSPPPSWGQRPETGDDGQDTGKPTGWTPWQRRRRGSA